MRALVCGQGFGYGSSGHASAHGVEARDLGIAFGLTKLGYDVHLVSRTEGPRDEDPRVVRVPWRDIDPETYDLVVYCEVTGWIYAQRDAPPATLAAIKAHPRSVALLDSVQTSTLWMRAVGLTSPQLVADHRRLFPMQPAFAAPWAFASVPEGLPNPWPDTRPRVINAGCVRPRYLAALNDLADDDRWEVWVCGLFAPSGTWGGLTDEERARLCNPRLHFVSDVVDYDGHTGRPPVTLPGHGPIRYGGHWPFLVHASIGLQWGEGEMWRPIACKLSDYLGAGLPVVTETGVPNCGDVITLNAGRVVPHDNPPAMRDAIVAELATVRDRDLIRRAAQAWCTWDDVACRIVEAAR